MSFSEYMEGHIVYHAETDTWTAGGQENLPESEVFHVVRTTVDKYASATAVGEAMKEIKRKQLREKRLAEGGSETTEESMSGAEGVCDALQMSGGFRNVTEPTVDKNGTPYIYMEKGRKKYAVAVYRV